MADSLVLPVPISYIQGRYLLFDIDAITYLRRNYQICGVFIGTLAQNPSQNVFMGLPMEIMPEEAQVLIDEAVGYILNDARAHDLALAKTNSQRQLQYTEENTSRAKEVAKEKAREKEFEKRRALKKIKGKQQAESMGSSTETVTATTGQSDNKQDDGTLTAETIADKDTDDSLFAPTPSQEQHSQPPISTNQMNPVTLTITPTTSQTLLPPPNMQTKLSRRIPHLNPASYALYKHLNSKSYFQTPGLRFGCQFCVYPGDPLRYHSHFLAVGHAWEEEIDLMDLVGGGRLGTGVKKGWLVGGREPSRDGAEGKVRTWSVEWAGI